MSVGQRGIVTPEAVVLDFEIAGLASRTLAFAIDVAGRMGVLSVLTLVAAVFVESAGGTTAGNIVLIVAGFVTLFGYSVACEVWFSGRSLGKLALGLRVVTVEGGPVRFRHAAVRAALLFIEVVLPPVCVLTILLTTRSQRLGDVFAGTIVVRDRFAQRDALAVTFPPPRGLEAYAASLDVSSLTEQQYEVLRGFLTRVFELTPGARAHLAARLAQPVAAAMSHTPPPGLHPELFLASVAAAYQRRHR